MGRYLDVCYRFVRQEKNYIASLSVESQRKMRGGKNLAADIYPTMMGSLCTWLRSQDCVYVMYLTFTLNSTWVVGGKKRNNHYDGIFEKLQLGTGFWKVDGE